LSTILLALIQGIMSRSRPPTSSIGCFAAWARISGKRLPPDSFSAIHSLGELAGLDLLEDLLHLGLGLLGDDARAAV
jgi:hypothetical protein